MLKLRRLIGEEAMRRDRERIEREGLELRERLEWIEMNVATKADGDRVVERIRRIIDMIDAKPGPSAPRG